MDAARFFEKALPRAIADSFEAFSAQEGSVSFAIGEVGAWTLRFGQKKRPIERGLAPDAELSLRFTERAFAGFVAGTLDVVEALDAGEVSFRGNPDLLARLGYLMTPKTNLLGVRSGGY
jgi:hypothetical protein